MSEIEKMNLQKIINDNFDLIAKNNEYPSLGHAIGLLDDRLRNALHWSTLRAYKKGYLHLLPFTNGSAKDLEKLGVVVFDPDGNALICNYPLPGAFMLLELMHPEKCSSPESKVSKVDFMKNFADYNCEPAGQKIIPVSIVQTEYTVDFFYRILEFETTNNAEEFMNFTYSFWVDFFRNKGCDPSRFLQLQRIAGGPIIILDLGNQTRLWLRYENIILSIHEHSEKVTEERKQVALVPMAMLGRNKTYLKLNE